MIVSVTLARGALRLAKRHLIVNRRSAIYALGGMDVLCTDKTGTLTEATIRTYANIMKYLMMVTSSNSGNMLSMATATLFLPFLPVSPAQIC